MKHFLITGTSTGIGLDLTKTLLSLGHRVWAGVRSPDVMQELETKYSKLMTVLELDVTRPDLIQNAYTKIHQELKHDDEFILVNNAGIAIGGPLETLPLQAWRDLFEVNVFGLIEVTRVFLPLLRKHQGRVINIGSISGRLATPYLGPYSSSKFAVRSLTDSLRREMLPRGVKVVLIEPGPIQTPIWDKSLERSHTIGSHATPEQVQEYQEAVAALNRGVKKTAAGAIPVSAVTDAILLASFKDHPKPYYLVGASARIRDLMNKVLPTLVMDKIMERGFRGVD